MKPLILAEHSLREFNAGIADLTVDFLFRFVWGPLPSPGELATYLGSRRLAKRAEEFNRHNPIHRWWGGTELTNDRLWRWDSVNRDLIAP